MIRTMFSFLALCSGLFFASWLIHSSIAAEKSQLPSQTSQSAEVQAQSGSERPTVLFPDELRDAGPGRNSDVNNDDVLTLNSANPSRQPSASPKPVETGRTSQAEEAGPVPAPQSAKIEERPRRFSEVVSSQTESPAKPVIPDGAPSNAKIAAPDQLAFEEFPLDSLDSTDRSSGAAAATNRVPDEEQTAGDPKTRNSDGSSAKSTPEEPARLSPPTPDVELSAEMRRLRDNVRDCLSYYYNKHDNIVDHSPWGIMHVLIAYGVDTEVIANGRKVNAIGWLCWNGPCRGQRLFELHGGKLRTHIGPGVQGHDGQFLAMMAQSRVQTTYPMRIDGKDFTLADLIEHEKLTCHAGTELTFKLIALAHYLESEAEWRNEDGEPWSISRLIKEELSQNVIGAACGGTHRMMGFNYAVQKRQRESKPLTGQWKRAKTFLDDYFDYTFYLQNDDGSFSTDFFRGRSDFGDINRRIETTGHILEWFVASLPTDKLQDPRVIKSVNYLTRLLLDNRNHDWEVGPRGHALHALAIYAERVFRDQPGQRDAILARQRQNGATQHH